jgi:hypothetical protein
VCVMRFRMKNSSRKDLIQPKMIGKFHKKDNVFCILKKQKVEEKGRTNTHIPLGQAGKHTERKRGGSKTNTEVACMI